MAGIYTWDAGVEGWVTNASSVVARDTATKRTGAGALKATKTVAAAAEVTVEASGPAYPTLTGDTLSAWFYIPVGSPGTGHHAQLRVMYDGEGPSPWGFYDSAYPGATITPGVWSQVELDITGVDFANVYRVDARIFANTTGGGGSLSFYLDDMETAADTPPPTEPAAAQIAVAYATATTATVTGSGAVAPDGETVTSYTVVATPVSALATPAKPTVAPGDTTATITFTSVADATSYTVETEPAL